MRERRSSPARSRLDKILAWILGPLLVLAPVPLGSNLPVLWGVWGTLIGMLGIGYAAGLALIGEKLHLAALRLPALLFGATLLFLAVQAALGFAYSPAGQDQTPGLVDILASVAAGETLLMMLRLLSYGLLFVLVYHLGLSGTRRGQLLRILALGAVLHAAYGILALTQLGDTLIGVEKWAYSGSATGTFVNRNSYATFLAMGLAINLSAALAHLAASNEKGRSGSGTAWLHGVGCLLIFAAVVASNSRMGLTVSVVAAAVVTLLFVVRNGAGRTMLIIGIPVASLVSVVVFLLYGSTLWERFAGTAQEAEVRLHIYRQTIDLIALRPLTGWGGGSFQQAFQLVHAPPFIGDRVIDRAHNTYLSLWAELGLPVGSLLIASCLLVLGRVALKPVEDRGRWMGQTACLAAALAAGLHSLVDFSLEMQANAFLLTALLAIGLGATTRRS